MSGELELLRWVRARLRRSGGVIVDSGDDAALVRTAGATLLKVDTVIEGVHFTRDTEPERVGHKALARPLSDIAAMGGVPRFALVAMMMPRSYPMKTAKRLYLGMEKLANRHGVRIVGGDVSTHPGKLALSVFVTGDMAGVKPVQRTGARVGDAVLVTGPLGRSIEGHHLDFEPRLEEGRLFATKHRVHAMIDISDGLAVDASHLGVGIDLFADRIPRSCGATLEQALHDGEDYELLVAADPATARRIESAQLAAIIGTVSKRPGIRVDGRAVRPRGYEHRFV